MSDEHPWQLAVAGITGDNQAGVDHQGVRVVNVVDLSDERDYDYWLDEIAVLT
jgi:hypothetical protein